jgi:protein phosphatase
MSSQKTYPYKVLFFGLSDVGLIRSNNEDVWGALPDVPFFALADGMGGHVAGEVAAAQTIFRLSQFVETHLKEEGPQISLIEAQERVSQAIFRVNEEVHKMSADSTSLKGMGTTLCCLYFHKDGLILAHVGDSRIYRLRNQQLVQLTEDHSLLKDLLFAEKAKAVLKKGNPSKHMITRAIGTLPKVTPTVSIERVIPGDLYMLCSDGLSDLVKKSRIGEILNEKKSLKEKTESLIALAKQSGGYDNITVVLSEVSDV